MVNLLESQPNEPLLPAGHHHRETAFWTALIVFDVLALYSIALNIFLAQWAALALTAVMALLITDVSLRFHRHNQDHLWLLLAATVISVILAALWSVVYWNQLLV